MGKRQRRRSARARFWQQPATLAQWATVCAAVVALAGFIFQLTRDGDDEHDATPTPTADPSSLPQPKLVHQTVEGNTLRATGTTDPLPPAYAIYLTARQIDANRENVSDPADVDAEWNWSASVELPTGDYEVSAVPAPTPGSTARGFPQLMGTDAAARLDVEDIRFGLTQTSRWTERYASEPVRVSVGVP